MQELRPQEIAAAFQLSNVLPTNIRSHNDFIDLLCLLIFLVQWFLGTMVNATALFGRFHIVCTQCHKVQVVNGRHVCTLQLQKDS